MKAYLLHLILRFSPKYSERDLSDLMAKLPDDAHRVLHERNPDDDLRSVAVVFLSPKQSAENVANALQPALSKFRDWNLIEVKPNVASRDGSASPLQHWLGVFYAELQRQEAPPVQESDEKSVPVTKVRRRVPLPRRKYRD